MASSLKTQPIRAERFEARLTTEQKDLLERAADLHDESLSQFVLRNALVAARLRLAEDNALRLTDRDRRSLVSALLDPPPPNAALRDAFRRYRKESRS